MKNSLAIITVIYENYDVLLDFLRSLEKQKNKNFHLFLSDLSKNKKALGQLNIDNQRLTIINGPNKGYAYGINLGLKKAIENDFQYFCIINNDTYFKENFIEKCLISSIHHPLSIIGGKIYYAPGFEYHHSKYKPTDIGHILWYAGGSIDWNNVITPHRGVDEIDKGQYNQFKETDFITGCLMVLDKSVLEKVGFFDESYFLYYEDADFCERAKRKNIKLYYDPKIIIWHKNAQSTGGAGSSLHQKLQHKNRLKFGLKYAPFRIKLHLIKQLIIK